jgi:hypothetical protein
MKTIEEDPGIVWQRRQQRETEKTNAQKARGKVIANVGVIGAALAWKTSKSVKSPACGSCSTI